MCVCVWGGGATVMVDPQCSPFGSAKGPGTNQNTVMGVLGGGGAERVSAQTRVGGGGGWVGGGGGGGGPPMALHNTSLLSHAPCM